MLRILTLGLFMTSCFCNITENNTENHAENTTTKKPCSPLLGHCNKPGQCCEPHVCLTYLAKCVTGNLSGTNNTINSIETVDEIKETSIPIITENTTGNVLPTSCSKIGEYCLTTTDCCKPFLCLTYAAKCVNPNLKETKI
ncbi:uncharacterized protein LOC129610519 [Condylostylus longicornis]|uniref:uncharacterized protein LOC129610519 n=1 Tax=Condylostylus longicornis TaxID=2530218 RepID=UPI00244E35DF|nr:uncharacterized protein LOC129610519 [Condylostylus longicornis]